LIFIIRLIATWYNHLHIFNLNVQVKIKNIPENLRPLFPPPLDRLLEINPDYLRKYKLGNRVINYLERLQITNEHLPALIKLAESAVNPEVFDNEDERYFYASVHAWRILGLMRAEAAIEPLLGILNALDNANTDWHLEEYPDVFAFIGESAVEPLGKFLHNPANRPYPRFCASSCLEKIAKLNPNSAGRCKQIIIELLKNYDHNDEDLNGFLIGDLVGLKAVEAAELIERAYAAGKVDTLICGKWGIVRRELGVPGLGLAEDTGPYKLPSALAQLPTTAKTKPFINASERNRKKRQRKQQKQSRKKNRRK